MTKLNMMDNSILDAESVLSRRDALKKAGLGAAALSLAGMGLAAKPAKAQLATATAALQSSIKMAHLQRVFYDQALASATLIPASTQAVTRGVITTIRDQKIGQETTLASILGSNSVAAQSTASYNFSGNTGAAGTPSTTTYGTQAAATSLTVLADFLEVAQLLEDFGVRVQKSAIAQMVSDANLASLFRIHSASGKHAGMVRILRAKDPFITAVNSDTAYGGTATTTGNQAYLQQLVYGPASTNLAGAASTSEDNQFHLGIGPNTASQSFDEPAVQADVALFFTAFGVV